MVPSMRRAIGVSFHTLHIPFKWRPPESPLKIDMLHAQILHHGQQVVARIQRVQDVIQHVRQLLSVLRHVTWVTIGLPSAHPRVLPFKIAVVT